MARLRAGIAVLIFGASTLPGVAGAGTNSCLAIAGPAVTSTAGAKAADCTFEFAGNPIRLRAEGATFERIDCRRFFGLGSCGTCPPFTWCFPYVFPTLIAGTIEATVTDAAGAVLAGCRTPWTVIDLLASTSPRLPQECVAEASVDPGPQVPLTCTVRITGALVAAAFARCSSGESMTIATERTKP